MLSRFIPRGLGITPSMLNLMKEVNQRRFITLLILSSLLGVDNLDEFINNTSF